jgi:hypothetical protein
MTGVLIKQCDGFLGSQSRPERRSYPLTDGEKTMIGDIELARGPNQANFIQRSEILSVSSIHRPRHELQRYLKYDITHIRSCPPVLTIYFGYSDNWKRYTYFKTISSDRLVFNDIVRALRCLWVVCIENQFSSFEFSSLLFNLMALAHGVVTNTDPLQRTFYYPLPCCAAVLNSFSNAISRRDFSMCVKLDGCDEYIVEYTLSKRDEYIEFGYFKWIMTVYDDSYTKFEFMKLERTVYTTSYRLYFDGAYESDCSNGLPDDAAGDVLYSDKELSDVQARVAGKESWDDSIQEDHSSTSSFDVKDGGIVDSYNGRLAPGEEFRVGVYQIFDVSLRQIKRRIQLVTLNDKGLSYLAAASRQAYMRKKEV